MTRWTKVFRDLWSNKARTMLVVLSIAVGVFALGAILTARFVVREDLAAEFAATNPAHARLFGRIDEDVLTAVRNMRGVDHAEASYDVEVQFLHAERGWRDVELVSVPNFASNHIHTFGQEAGRIQPRLREIVIERGSVDYVGVGIGDTVTLQGDDGKTYDLTVVGIIHDLQRISAEFNNEATAYVATETLGWMGYTPRYDELELTFSGDTSDREANRERAEAIRQRLEAEGVPMGGMWVPVPGEHEATPTINAVLVVLGILGGLALALSGFLVINTVAAVLAQHRRQIGVMKMVGARGGQIVWMYLTLVLAFGALSLLVAVPLGVVGAYGLTQYIASTVNFNLNGLPLHSEVIAAQTGIALVVPVLAAAVPVLSGTRVTVREALSDYGIRSSAHRTLLDRIVERVRGLPRPLLFALRNTFRRKVRLALTLFTLTLAGATFVSVFSVRDSLNQTVDDALLYWGYDVEVGLGGNHRLPSVTREAQRVPGVASLEGWLGGSAPRVRPDGIVGDTFSLLGVPADSQMIEPIVLEGRWLLPADQNAVVLNTEYLKYEEDLAVGSTLTLEINGRDEAFEVVGIVQGLLTGPIAYINYPYMASVMRMPGQVNRLLVNTDAPDAAGRLDMALSLEERLQRSGLNGASAETMDTVRSAIEYQFNVLVVFLMIMAGLLTVVGGLGLMGTIAMNVLERTREIGVLRAVGASDGGVRMVIIVEAVIIGLISWLLGVVLALPLGKLLSDAIGLAFIEEQLQFVYSLPGVTIWLGVTLVLAVAASWLPALRASRLSVREVLAYE